ncbi:TPR-like protein [Suillus bovinus]|uniref:TPR-like protein n=1 Tax=Suillus bovinus TaxID=48563 RepID=UPI001B8819CA|nr:TPR-like protein [Suillus bovinus]KAG2151628.1 TPR-like protein [Suillus bovinus]
MDSLALETDAGHSLLARYRRTQNSGDLDQSINHFERALDLCPVDHPYRPAALFNLATAKFLSCQANGIYLDVDIPISLFQGALDSRPMGHPDRPTTQLHLAISLLSRFAKHGFQTDADTAEDKDLDEAIVLDREMLALHPVGHPDRFMPLNNLAAHLSSRFKHRGNEEDLDEAIVLHTEALALCPVGHTGRSISLNNLARQLSSRFKHRGNEEDLDQAIALHTEALALRPIGHVDRSMSLNNLAFLLSSRFEHRDNEEDLDEAIALHTEALDLHPVGHTDRFMPLNNFAVDLCSRFKHRGNEEDLDQAIALHTEVLALCPVGHTDRSTSLNNLALDLSSRFEHRGNEEDLDEAIALHKEALALRPFGHADRSMSLSNLAIDLSSRFEHRGNEEDLDEARENLRSANIVSGGPLSRLQTSFRWVRYAEQHRHDTQLEAYETSVSSRHRAMKDFPLALAVDAASYALRSGDVRRAVELLEQGRTIIWTQMTRLRMPVDGLQTRSDHAAALLKRFRYLSSLLDKPLTSLPEGTLKIDVEAEETRYRRLVKEWNSAVEEIRNIEGLSRFLLPPLFSDLQDAARDGPIIVLIGSKSSFYAIVIPHKQTPISIQLSISVEKLQILVDKLHRTDSPALKKALTELWDDVVCPVVENLDGIAPRGSRIWWCPTSVFNFLPLHAAGEYRKQGRFLSHLYISSYTPSLTALIKARRSHERSPSVPFVAIGQNRPAGATFTLDAVEPELELVRSLLPPPPTISFSKITSVDATKSRALCALRDNTWLHLACHGTQNIAEPFKSAFLMRDEPLSLLDITQTDLSRHQFAFLSACETAVGDRNTLDEVIHLAAGLQFAGVKSVIGTLWKVNDSTVERLVKAFYKHFCGDGTVNSKRAARALHRAVYSLGSDQDIPLNQRILFVHIGI